MFDKSGAKDRAWSVDTIIHISIFRNESLLPLRKWI
jgi:hypothetical protein